MEIFETLFIEKADNFKNAYKSVSRKLFYDENKKLIHPGEFGSYREAVLKDFIRLFVPGRLAIDQGFIITTKNSISTQCDVIIYDKNTSPLIESGGRQRFFPVESVVAVGEAKSVLSKNEFKDALLKLSGTKALREEIDSPVFARKDHNNSVYNPVKNVKDNLFTFIVCEKLDFDLKNIPVDLSTMYGDTPHYRKHNMVFSLEDGILVYYHLSGDMPSPITPEVNLKNRFIKPTDNKYLHFKLFCSYLFLGTTSGSTLYPEMTEYIGSLIGGMKYDEMEGEKT